MLKGSNYSGGLQSAGTDRKSGFYFFFFYHQANLGKLNMK